MQQLIIGLLGGLALFLFGMQMMGDGLQKAAGDRMRRILEALTSIPLVGVLVGSLVTALIQSSSATTVMVVGFVNAGLMTLKQAIGVIMGANIGTTITAQLIAFKLSNWIFPIITLGFALHFLGKRKGTKYLGQVLLGFGILLLGLGTMTQSMAPLKDYQGFRDFLISFGHNPLLGVSMGIVMTVMVQSSSASMGILIAMATQGLLPFESAFPVLLGTNIGTCITALLASIGTCITAKRAAFAHVLFNVFGTIIFLLAMKPFIQFVLGVTAEGDIVRQIANAHTLFNVINTILFLPIINIFHNLLIRMVPGEETVAVKCPVYYLDERMLPTPGIALSLATKELARMAEMARQNVDDAMAVFHGDDKKLAAIGEREELIDQLEEEITAYLAKLSQKELPPSLSRRHTGLLHAVNDIERVGDHAENMAQLAMTKLEENLPFSETALEELNTMYQLVRETFTKAVHALEADSKELASCIAGSERNIDTMERDLRRSHISRLNAGKCFPGSGVVFLDMISNLERVGDHSYNIAQVVLDEL